MQAELSTYIFFIPLKSISSTSYILNTYHRASLLPKLYGFSKSMKPTYTTFFLLCILTYYFYIKIWFHILIIKLPITL